jgi:hypothetical protein
MRCAYCHEAFAGERDTVLLLCERCCCSVHRDCGESLDGCPVLGCTGAWARADIAQLEALATTPERRSVSVEDLAPLEAPAAEPPAAGRAPLWFAERAASFDALCAALGAAGSLALLRAAAFG